MADVDELLKNQKLRLQKMEEAGSTASPIVRKKIQRIGPTRPWQENLPQYQEPPTKYQQTGNKVPTEVVTKYQQTGNKVPTIDRFLALSGLQSSLIIFLYQLCRMRGERLLENIRVDYLANSLKSTIGAIKETVRRLEKKGFISRTGFRNGRGGSSHYSLSEDTYKELFQLESTNKLVTKYQQSTNKVPSQVPTEVPTSFPSSSSSYVFEDLKTTTTGEPELFALETARLVLAPEWERVDHSSLTDIGFTPSHLIQVARQGKITAQETQDSIHFFAFDLRRNGKALSLNGSPLNFFMGILRKGIPYAPPENYVSPEDELRREYRERMKSLEEKRVSEAQEIWDLHFRQWESKLSGDECARILPEYAKKSGPMRENCLKSHFNEHVWPELRETVPGIQTLFNPLQGPSSENVDLRPAT